MSGFQIIPDANAILFNGETVNLTNTEFSIFHHLYQHNKGPSTREELISQLENANSSRNIDVYISGLRKKVQKINLSIETVRGIGYKLVMNER